MPTSGLPAGERVTIVLTAMKFQDWSSCILIVWRGVKLIGNLPVRRCESHFRDLRHGEKLSPARSKHKQKGRLESSRPQRNSKAFQAIFIFRA
jgi:hypothetical protein